MGAQHQHPRPLDDARDTLVLHPHGMRLVRVRTHGITVAVAISSIHRRRRRARDSAAARGRRMSAPTGIAGTPPAADDPEWRRSDTVGSLLRAPTRRSP